MLFSQLPENIAHCLYHEGKCSNYTDRRIFCGLFIRMCVIATEIEIILLIPLYDDLKGFDVAHLL